MIRKAITKAQKLEQVAAIIWKCYEDRFPSEQHSGAGLADFTDEAAKQLLKKYDKKISPGRRLMKSPTEIEAREKEWDLRDRRERITARVYEMIIGGGMDVETMTYEDQLLLLIDLCMLLERLIIEKVQ